MMKTAHRSSGSGLPLTKNMPFASNSVPSRSQPRNMTGIYLGLEGNIKPPQKTNVPPLARGRGTSVKTRTPSEHKRYKLVEKMRIKEEKRGFVGQTIKTSRRTLSASGTENLEKKRVTISSEFPENFKEELIPYPKPKSWGPAKYADRSEFFDLIRTNPRNYTVVVNNGVTRSENLSGPMSFPHGHEEVSWQDLLAEEVHRMSMKEIDETSGLEECYKKICKGNVNSLYSLLPHRNKMNRDGPQYTTGFTVKSYNNLNRAEILADFSSANARPRTVPLNRPIVPSPYFFKYYNTNSYHSKYPPISSAKSARSRVTNGQVIDNPFSVMNDNRIFGLPGSGAVTRSLRSRNSAWTESDLRLHAKLHSEEEALDKEEGSPQDNTGDDTGMKDVVVSGRQVQVPALGESATATAQETQRSEVTAAPVTEPPGQPVITIETESVDPKQLDSFSKGRSQSAEGVRNSDMETVQMSNQEMSFVLGVADEHGKEGEVEIDEADVNPEEQDVVKEPPLRGNVRKASITEKVEKSRVSAAYIESIKENAEQRKKNLEKMLDEHAEIVQEISRVASSDNISAEDRDQ